MAAPVDLLPVEHAVVADHQVALRPDRHAQRHQQDDIVRGTWPAAATPISASVAAMATIDGATCTRRLQNGALNSAALLE